MARKLQNTIVWTAIALMVGSAATAHAEGRLAGLLSGGGPVAAAPVNYDPGPTVEGSAPASKAPVAESGAADLALEDLQQVARATVVAGPAYVLRFRNQGSATANGFHVALLAGVHGQVSQDSPRALAYLARVAPGETMEVTLRLPASATQIPDADGRRTMMTDVFVTLDFADAIAELDEMNNLAIIPVGALQTAMR